MSAHPITTTNSASDTSTEMSVGKTLLLCYYGDDFTGSTDALEFLSLAGIKTVLFIEPPTSAQLQRYPGLQAIGVAGSSRSMQPAGMETSLTPAFSALRALGAPHVHYKVCSTFDSSPAIGSIGKAIDIGAAIFEQAFIPLLVAAPALGRYCAFGNLFARMGIGSQGKIHRLDRHPSMSKHPVTPAHESDLRLHLAKQTDKKIGLFDILQIGLPPEEQVNVLQKTVEEGAEVVLFDAIYPQQMAGIGRLIDSYATNSAPLFSVGSSGIEMALGQFWQQSGKLPAPKAWPVANFAGPILVISGSCSPVSASQIDSAIANGFAEIALDTVWIANTETIDIEQYAVSIAILINNNKSVILHTSKGRPEDRQETTYQTFLQKGYDEATIRSMTGKLFGSALGSIARSVAGQTNLRRIIVAGGDTSSFAARAMGIEAVEMIAPLSPGAPLCKAYAPGSPIDGLEVNFKGGQVGKEDYYTMALGGV